MSTDPTSRDPASEAETLPPTANLRWLQFLELSLSVVVLSALTLAVALLAGLALGGEALGTAKVLLFPIGFLLMGIGALELRPTSAWRDEPIMTIEPDEETRLQRLVMSVPPLRGHHIPFESRVSRGAKAFVTGLVALAISFVMEVGFGI